jgi:hypothetical protein
MIQSDVSFVLSDIMSAFRYGVRQGIDVVPDLVGKKLNAVS